MQQIPIEWSGNVVLPLDQAVVQIHHLEIEERSSPAGLELVILRPQLGGGISPEIILDRETAGLLGCKLVTMALHLKETS